MKKRFSEYVGYDYSGNEEWFNPLVEWDTPLFLDPMLLKTTKIKEFVGSYDKIVEFFKNAMIALDDREIPNKIKLEMLNFREVTEANLGYAYNSNRGKGLSGADSKKIIQNLKLLLRNGILELKNFEAVTIFDKNINVDKMSDMIINIVKECFINYSYRIASEYGFPTTKFKRKIEYNFEELRWDDIMVEMPYIVNDTGINTPIILVPKDFLVTQLNVNADGFISWLYDNHKNDYR